MAFRLFKRKTPKACVIGLDGVPCSLLQRMMEMGVMPNMRDLVGRGTLASMTVSLPEISSVSWSSFMTGKNPGEHGIYGFTDLKDGGYALRFPSFRDLKTETIWDRLGKKGLRSIVINQPSTYPAREIPGVLISGFVAIDLAKALYPRKYLASLARARYRVDIDTEKSRADADFLFKDLDDLLECRKAVMDELWEKEEWSLMQMVITGTDRLYHFMWDAWEDANHPHHGAFLDYHRNVDRLIGYIYEKFLAAGDGDNFFLLSDHGFCGTQNEVYVNSILQQNGFLSLDSANPDDLEGITKDSKAFALDPARIYIHRKGRFARGGVEESDVEKIKSDIKELLASFQQEGPGETDGILRRVFDAADVYSGPEAHLGPDLCVIPTNGYDMKGKVGADTIVGERHLQGMHTWDDAFFFSLRKDLMTEGEDLTIFDTPWKILRSLDVEE